MIPISEIHFMHRVIRYCRCSKYLKIDLYLLINYLDMINHKKSKVNRYIIIGTFYNLLLPVIGCLYTIQ